MASGGDSSGSDSSGGDSSGSDNSGSTYSDADSEQISSANSNNGGYDSGNYGNGDSDVELSYNDETNYASGEMTDSEGNAVDNYEASYLDSGNSWETSGSSIPKNNDGNNMWAYIVASLCAATVGAALVVSRVSASYIVLCFSCVRLIVISPKDTFIHIIL